MTLDLVEMKDAFIEAVTNKIKTLKLNKKVKEYKQRVKKAQKEFEKYMNKLDLKDKLAEGFASVFNKNQKEKKNSVIVVISVIAGLVILFCALVAFFYAFYDNAHKKKTAGYYTVNRSVKK